MAAGRGAHWGDIITIPWLGNNPPADPSFRVRLPLPASLLSTSSPAASSRNPLLATASTSVTLASAGGGADFCVPSPLRLRRPTLTSGDRAIGSLGLPALSRFATSTLPGSTMPLLALAGVL